MRTKKSLHNVDRDQDEFFYTATANSHEGNTSLLKSLNAPFKALHVCQSFCWHDNIKKPQVLSFSATTLV